MRSVFRFANLLQREVIYATLHTHIVRSIFNLMESHFMSELQHLFQENKERIKTLEFSQEIFREVGEVRLCFNLEEALSLYRQLDSVMAPHSQYRDFVEKGIRYFEQGISKGAVVTSIMPNSCHMLNIICDLEGVILPKFIPATFKIDEPNGIHNFTYLYNWATVQPHLIHDQHVQYFILKLAQANSNSGKAKLLQDQHRASLLSLRERLDSKKTEEQNGATHTAAGITPEDSSSLVSAMVKSGVAPKSEHLHVLHSLHTARKYISLFESARRRNLAFDLDLDDVSALLKQKRCYYTAAELVSFEHEPGATDLPDNYLTVDRVDNNKGYIRGNVVACSQMINKMKDQMGAEEFQRAINLQRALNDMGVSKEVLEMMQKMAALNISSPSRASA